jgi:putative endonuclease
MKQWNQQIGHWGEEQAAMYLRAQGLEILAHNVRTPYGELDLIAREGEVLVFVEVKTRSSDRFGHPEDAVDMAKQQHVLNAIEHYLLNLALPWPGDWRVDVIAVLGRPGEQVPQVEWFRHAFS